MTPTNYGYIKNFVGTTLSKDELDKVLSQRAKWLNENASNVELHVHFWKFKNMPEELKRKHLKEAIEWGEKNGIEFNKIVPGWWGRDEEDLTELYQEFGLKKAKKEISTHDYNL